MRVAKYRHACLLIEDGDARLLVDPGRFSEGFEDLTDLTAVLITHQHSDHLDLERLRTVLDHNPEARVLADIESAQVLKDTGVLATAMVSGDSAEVGTSVEAFGQTHATIHPDIPPIANVGFLIGGRFFHPGDALTDPGVEIEILGLPAVAPWMAAAGAVDYLRAIEPAVAIPIHEAVTSVPAMYYRYFTELGPERTHLEVIDSGEPIDL